MAHAHHDHAGHGHAHDAPGGDYYLEQLLTIGVCGSVGVIGVLMYFSRVGPAGGASKLGLLLAPEFHLWVLLGSLALLAMTAVRMAALWVQVGAKAADGHVHGPDCDHGHAHAGHSHGDGAVYLKVIPFTLVVMLYVMGLPNTSFSKEWVNSRLGQAPELGELKEFKDKGGDAIGFDFNELNAATLDPDKRAEFEGKRVRVKGQLKRVSEKDYQLFKLKMTCCAADVTPLKARIKSDIVIPESQFPDQSWANVEGVLQFVELPEKRQFLPVIRIGGASGLGLSAAAPE